MNRLQQNDEAEESLVQPGNMKRKGACYMTGHKHTIATFSLSGAMFFLVLWGVLSISTRRSSLESSFELQEPLVCGNSSTSALALGCKFSLAAFGWSREECFDQAIENEYLESITWGYWLDRAGTEEVNATFASQGDHVIWTTWGQHYWHCVFMLKKLTRSTAINGSGVRLTNFEIGTHAEHCIVSMLDKNAIPWDEIMDRMEPNFLKCY
jgi:hypothetical protein